MSTELKEKQSTFFGITGSAQPVDIHSCSDEKTGAAVEPSRPTSPRLPEGWHSTERYGDVFVSPGGIAWAVQLVGDKFENISVKITHEDITAKLSAERMKHAAAEKRRYNLAKQIRTPPLQPLQRVSTSIDEVSEASA